METRADLRLDNYGSSLTRAGAEILAGVIVAHWRHRGYAGVRVWVEDLPSPTSAWGPTRIHVIRSNIAPLGYPPRTPHEETDHEALSSALDLRHLGAGGSLVPDASHGAGAELAAAVQHGHRRPDHQHAAGGGDGQLGDPDQPR